MTKKRQELRERLSREFMICDKHIQRINEALSELDSVLPLTVDNYAYLENEKVRCLDQFIFRFSKLQDAMGAKIFRYALELWDEDVSSMTMQDVLNSLEKYKILPSADEWRYIRELRNDIAHDYPLYENDIVVIINELISKTSIIVDIYTNLKYLKQATPNKSTQI